MRLTYSGISIFAAVVLTSSGSIASPTSHRVSGAGGQTIYGLSNTKTFISSSHGKFYIQAGSFRSVKNANRYKVELSKKYSYRVIVKKQHGYQVVLLGPISSVAAVRALSGSDNRPVFVKQETIEPIHQKHSVIIGDKDGIVAPVARPWAWVGTISAGPVSANGGETQTFFLTPDITKTYVAQKSSKALASGELFLGVQRSFSSQLQGQLGLALAATSNAKMQGIIWDDADPEFDNYSYQYKVQHSRVALKGKLIADQGYWLMPWLSGSVGVGFNRAHSFSNTPLFFEALPNNNFSDNTKTSFTYTLGAGVQKTLNQHWQAGLGYEFADWGKSQLGRAVGQTLNSGLALSHLYTNGILFNLTYLA